jgi:carbamoyl-phosphate synthase small subunit
MPQFHPRATAALVLGDGSVFRGKGIGAAGTAGGEVCFNTSMSGYQEIMTDPSYAGQIVTFTFPHIGNTGANAQDNESARVFSKGLILKADITAPSSHRADEGFQDWLCRHGLTGICNIDTRALTHCLRDHGAQNGVICHAPDGRLDIDALLQQARALPPMDGMDIARTVTCAAPYDYASGHAAHAPHVVVVDYGVKQNILRCLALEGLRLTVVPCTAAAEDIFALSPDGVFLSNGPGDPAATGAYAVPVIQKLLASGLPLFGICLGHQLLAIALGARTEKLPFGHRGGNHPVKDLETGCVEITSQNHGFHVVQSSLPATAETTHVSLFDKTNEGFRLKGRPVFSVQYHPEASPGPEDSRHLFRRFAALVGESRRKTA